MLMRFARYFRLVAFAILVLAGSRSPALAKLGDEAEKAAAVLAPQTLAEQPSPSETPQSNAPRAGGELPWRKRKKNEPLPLIRPPAGVGEILERYDIGPTQLEGLINLQPLGMSEEETLVRIMYRLPRIGLESIEKWRRSEVQLDRLVADPTEYRLDVIPLQGRLIGLERRDVSPELGQRLEIPHYYLARVDLVGQGHDALVALRHVPAWWENNQELNEPVSFDGIFLKVAEVSGDKPRLLFLSRRLRWHPDQPRPARFVGDDQLRLAALGLDLTLLDDLRSSNRRDIGDIDREPMYQLLSLVGNATREQLLPQPPRAADVVPLLEEPERHHGEIVTLTGIARRISKLVVDDPDIRARFKIDHYYVIDMGVNLGEKSIRFGDDPTGEKNAVFHNDFPVTLCVRELPANLQPGDNVRELITAHGIFMKTWAYRSAYTAHFENKLQLAPLFIAYKPRRVKLEHPNNWVSDALVGFVLFLAAFIVATTFWWFRTGIPSRQQALKDLAERGERPSFQGLEDAPVTPDFSSLEARYRGPTPEDGSDSPPR